MILFHQNRPIFVPPTDPFFCCCLYRFFYLRSFPSLSSGTATPVFCPLPKFFPPRSIWKSRTDDNFKVSSPPADTLNVPCRAGRKFFAPLPRHFPPKSPSRDRWSWPPFDIFSPQTPGPLDPFRGLFFPVTEPDF